MGRLGTVITQTPFRISFFGGGTDFPSYFNERGGAVLGTTINKYLYVTVNSLERLLEKRIRLSYSNLEIVDQPEDLKHELVRQTLINHKEFMDGGFLDIHSFADLPNQSGVGSSSSFEVGFLNALYLLHGLYKLPKDLAREAILIEREQLGHHGGWQDQIHAAFGGLNKISFAQNDFHVTPVCVPRDRLEALETSCMFFFTGSVRSSTQVQNSVFGKGEDIRLRTSKEVHLKRMLEMVDEGVKILSQAQGIKAMLAEFGALLDEAWYCKRSFSSLVSNPTIDDIHEVAKRAGAYGGKLVGAGGGGFMLFVVPEDRRNKVIRALSGLRQIHVRFEAQGSRAVFANQIS